MTVVVGTAGHIDHGKTTLLRALTGIDADRLPEERARGMTIDVGYAHLALGDGTELDFVDVPGHDRLIGNMLVGAGEIDAAMLVVAADDGPRAQTIEHLELLDALAIDDGIAIVTKTDSVPPDRVAAVVDATRDLLAPTTLGAAPVVTVSASTGDGLPELREVLLALRERVGARHTRDAPGRLPTRGARLAIDRVFSIRGRGTVVTGSLRAGSVTVGESLRVVPGPSNVRVRVREVQVHGRPVESAGSGRVALNVTGVPPDRLARGVVLTTDPDVITSERLLVAFRPVAGIVRTAQPRTEPAAPADRTRVLVNLGTAQTPAVVGRSGVDTMDLPTGETLAVLRLDAPIAVAAGDRFVLRRPSPRMTLGGGRIIDADPPRGVARRRATAARVTALAGAPARSDEWHAARLALHGALVVGGRRVLADDVAAAVGLAVVAAAATRDARRSDVLRAGSAALRRHAGAVSDETEFVEDRIERAVADGLVVRDGDRFRLAGTTETRLSSETLAAMDRLVLALSTPSPPGLRSAAADAGCPPEGIRAVERDGRIVPVDDDLAWATEMWQTLAARALAMATTAPLTPAAYRDATGTSRKYVMALLEDLDRRAILRRTPAGHVPGPRAGQVQTAALHRTIERAVAR